MQRRTQGLMLGLAALAMIAVACGSSKSSSKTSGGTTGTTTAAKQGGDLVAAAEQEPDCADWIGSCSGALWGDITFEGNTMPKAYDFTNKSEYAPSIVLTGEADLVTSPQQKITYHINPKAVWSDGQPITSTDFWYTWDQVAHGKDIYDTTGYANIASVDHTDPQTAVVTLSKPFADWKYLFSGFYGIFPSHLLQGKDRDALMKDGYNWSGGPWMLDHWTKGVEMKFVPNPNYWGHKPYLNSLTFKFITDTAAEQEAVKSGQVDVSYPQAQPGQEALKGLPGISFDAVSGLAFEGIYFNVQKAPLDSKPVRQALIYALDRNAIVKQLFGAIQPDIKPIQSSYTPAFGAAYTEPFAKYTQDLKQVDTLMTGAGWAKGADGIWAKGGQKANLELKTTTGNKRRLLTSQILQSEWKAAGFGLTITTEKAGVLFGQDLPSGNFQMGLYAQTPSDNDPSECNLWCSKNIPTAANGQSGQNFDRFSDPAVDTAYQEADTNLDTAKRISAVTDAQKAIAEAVPLIPLDPFPDINVINTGKLANDSGTFLHNFAFGPFVYADHWYLK